MAGRVPGWFGPSVAVCSPVAGVAGGAVGGVAYEHFRTDNVGTVSSGLAGADPVNAPPLAADNGSVAAVAQELLKPGHAGYEVEVDVFPIEGAT